MKRADRIIWGNDDVTRASPAPVYATRRDALPLPSYPPFKLSQVADAVFDIFVLAFWCLLIFVAGIAVTFAMLCPLFVAF